MRRTPLAARRSRAAGWSSYLAALSLPILIIAAIGHRNGMFEAVPTFTVIAIGFLCAALAVLAAVAAFVSIWRLGTKGLGAALRGFIVGLAVLALPAYGAWKVVTEPRLNDISTDLANPPPLDRAVADRGASDVPVLSPTAVDANLQHQAYPDIVPRHYPVSTARVFAEAKAIVDKRGWHVLVSKEPDDKDASGLIEAVAQTLVFGFRQDVAIRMVEDGDGTRVDMRSAARTSAHDLGSDADRVRGFFNDLDDALEGVSGSGQGESG
jgi:hypothetical protein